MFRPMNAMGSAASVVSSVADRLGYAVIPKWRLGGREHALLLAELFERLSVDCVLDVGANRGGFRDFVRMEVGFNGRIISFEPVKEVAKVCKRKALECDPLWEVLEIALGDQDSITPMHVMEKDKLNSFLMPDDTPITRKHFGQDFVSGGNKISVEMRRLQTVLPELKDRFGFVRPYLKMDTQGFDLNVVAGCGGSLSQIPALQTEMSVIPIYKNMPTWIQAIEKLKELGFGLAGAFPVSRDDNFRIIEFDGVFTRQPS